MKEFIFTTSTPIFPHICTVLVNLLKLYVNNLNKKEAEARIKALVTNRNTMPTTVATAEASDADISVTSKNMMKLIDDHNKVAIKIGT